MLSSTERLVRMLVQLGKHSVKYKEGKKEQVFFPAARVEISPSFFRSYLCRCCGWCCRGVTLDWVIGPQIALLHDDSELFRTTVSIQDRMIPIWRIANEGTVCRFLSNDNRCAIHSIKPFSCRFELFKVRMQQHVASLTLTYPARKWIVRNGRCAQCVIIPATYESLMQSIADLKEMHEIADSFGIRTWIPEIVGKLLQVRDPEFIKEKIFVGENK